MTFERIGASLASNTEGEEVVDAEVEGDTPLLWQVWFEEHGSILSPNGYWTRIFGLTQHLRFLMR